MMSAQFFLGASLFALLAVGTHCVPVKKGFSSPGSYDGSHTNEAPSFRSNYGASTGSYAPGDMSYNAPSRASYQPVPQPEPQPAVYREPAAPVESSSVSGPVESRHSSSAVRGPPVGSLAPGAAFQPGSREFEWAVKPPSIFGGEVPAAAAGYVSPPLPPPEPELEPLYQAGELTRSEHSFESGDFERETEETGFLPPVPPPLPLPVHESTGPSFTSQPRPMPYPGWGFYPYYDYMFLTGQYPPGTVSHASSSFEQGRDHWQDVHYVRDHYPQNPRPVQQAEHISDYSAPRQDSKAVLPPVLPYGGAAVPGLPWSSHGRPAQPPGRHVDYNRVKI